jgi:hypothetical protein
VREKYCWLVADKPSEQGGTRCDMAPITTISVPGSLDGESHPGLSGFPLSGAVWSGLDLSISRAGPGSGRVEKNSGFSAEKILPMTVPWDMSGLSLRAGLEPGPGLGGPPAHFIV